MSPGKCPSGRPNRPASISPAPMTASSSPSPSNTLPSSFMATHRARIQGIAAAGTRGMQRRLGRLMRPLALAAGIACLVVVLFDAFQTIILPRRATGRFRLTRIFYVLTWRPWVFFAQRLRHPRKRETAFSYYGPLSLILLLIVWAGAMVVGFGLIFYSLGSPLHDTGQQPGFRSDLYISGTTLFTLGLGDVTPHSPWARVFIILESGT